MLPTLNLNNFSDVMDYQSVHLVFYISFYCQRYLSYHVGFYKISLSLYFFKHIKDMMDTDMIC